MTRLLTDLEHLIDQADWLNEMGQPIEAITTLGQVLDELASNPPSPLQARALRGIGFAFRTLGDIAESALAYKEALEVAIACGSVAEEAESLNGVAIAQQLRGELLEAEERYAQAAGLALREGLLRLAGSIEQNRGVIAGELGQRDVARQRYQAALDAFEGARDAQGVCWTLNNLALLAAEDADAEMALDTFERARRLADEVGDRALTLRIEVTLGEALIELGDWSGAEEVLESAVRLARTSGSRHIAAEALRYLAQVQRLAGNPWNALRTIREATSEASAAPDLLLVAETRREEGDCWMALGDAGRARDAWSEAEERFEEVGAKRDGQRVRELLAELP